MIVNLLIIAGLSLLIEIAYFSLAKRFSIVDRPNHRTLHEKVTIRGGGIVFPLTIGMYFIFYGVASWPFAVGLLIITIISFVDDLGHVNSFLRFVSHLGAIILISWDTGYFEWNPWLFMLVVIISTGILNAYNFMDGINGLTGGYSFVVMSTLIFINYFIIPFETGIFLWTIWISILVFNFFNFRNKAVCFAGDVGSISIAFIIIYLLLKIIIATQNPIYILLLTVYGIDSIYTIIQRLLKRENIFEAHRSHLFQLIVFHRKVPHLQMTIIYLVIQMLINTAVIYMLSLPFTYQIFLSLFILLILSLTYWKIKFKFVNM